LLLEFKKFNTRSEVILEKMRSQLQSNREACVIFDDTVLPKRFYSKIQVIRSQYSGNEHRVIPGIGCLALYLCKCRNRILFGD
jgi:hypothetical protein